MSAKSEVVTVPRQRWRRMSVARRAVVPAALLATWVLVGEFDLIDPLFVPPPDAVWQALVDLRPTLGTALLSSVSMTLLGFFIGTSVGIATGLIMAYSKIARELLSGVLDIIRPVPIFALIPLFLLWFGIGRTPQVTLIALGTSVTLGVTTADAIRNVSAVHIKAALTLGATRGAIYRTIIVPSILPHLLGAIRVAALASWGLNVAAEFLGAQEGLGHTMIVRQQYLDSAGIVLICIIYSVLAILFDLAIRQLEKPLTRWTERSVKEGPVGSVLGHS